MRRARRRPGHRVGRTVDATVRGDTAYSWSLGLPLLLIGLGLPPLVLPVAAMRSRRRHTTAARPVTSDQEDGAPEGA